MIDQWNGCYDDGWYGDIVPESFSHPAKFSRGLINKIYKHAKEMGWVNPGDYVLDPFGGVALGGLDACSMGLNWIGIELEEKFVKLGHQNIDLWNRQLKGWPNLGTARIVRGDSRRLKDVIREAPLIVSSPPFASSEITGLPKNRIRDTSNPKKHGAAGPDYIVPRSIGQLSNLPESNFQDVIEQADLVVSSPFFDERAVNKRDQQALRKNFKLGISNYSQNEYGHTPGNLANMMEGDIDLVVSSPPFTGQLPGDHKNKGDYKVVGPHDTGKRIGDGYGHTPGNLANMREGDIDLICSSPPFCKSLSSGSLKWEDALKIAEKQNDKWKQGRDKAGVENQAKGKMRMVGHNMGHSPGQLGSMKEGDIDMVVGSPPYIDKFPSHDNFIAPHDTGKRMDVDYDSAYGQSPGQLGSMKEGSFDMCVSSPPWEDNATGGLIKFKNSEEYAQKMSEFAKVNPRSHGGSAKAYLRKMERDDLKNYGQSNGQLGNSSGDTFWSASREIVQGCYELLKDGGHAIWVCKDYIKAKKRVPFSNRWLALCESVGFKLVCRHQAMLVKPEGEQATIRGSQYLKTERKSFFRRNHETKVKADKFWPTLDIDIQNEFLDLAKKQVTINPTEKKILQKAQVLAFQSECLDDRPYQNEIMIQHEDVICLVKK